MEEKKYLTFGEIYQLALLGDAEKEQDLYNLVENITKDYLNQFDISKEEKQTTVLEMENQTKTLILQAREDKEAIGFNQFMEIISNTLQNKQINRRKK